MPLGLELDTNNVKSYSIRGSETYLFDANIGRFRIFIKIPTLPHAKGVFSPTIFVFAS